MNASHRLPHPATMLHVTGQGGSYALIVEITVIDLARGLLVFAFDDDEGGSSGLQDMPQPPPAAFSSGCSPVAFVVVAVVATLQRHTNGVLGAVAACRLSRAELLVQV